MPERLDLHKIIEHSPLAIAVLDCRGRFLLINNTLAGITGYSRRELYALHFTDLIHPDDRVMVQDMMHRNLSQASTHLEYDFRCLTRDGQIRFVNGSFSGIEEGGEPAILGQLRDVTDKKRIEMERHKEEERYRTVLHLSDIGYFEVDLAGNLMYFTDVICRHLGFEERELKGTNFKEYTDRANTTLVTRTFKKVLKTGRPQPFFDWEIIGKDGRRLAIQTSVALKTDSQGRPVGFRGIVRNVTDKKRTEAALRRSRERYRSIFEGAGTAMIIYDQSLTLRMVNQQFIELTGFDKAELENRRSLLDFIIPEDADLVQRHHQRLRSSSEAWRLPCEFRLRDRQGRLLNILGYINRMPDGHLVASFLDLTERKKMEQKLKHLSLHDPMTGLFNRYYFEKELERCKDGRQAPIGLVVCDLDGLKQINDTFGHKTGDALITAAAKIIRHAFRESDMVARIGGDEFAALLPKSDRQAVLGILERLHKAVQHYNRSRPDFPLHLSTGFAVDDGRRIDPAKLFKEADKAMYRNKQRLSQTIRPTSLHSLDAMLENQGLRHRKLEVLKLNLALDFAEFLKLNDDQLNRLQLLTRFYDIGKMGIDDSILLKPNKLTDREFQEVSRHCQLGHSIAQRTRALQPVSEDILAHHERWDGRGYPYKLSAGQIPLLARMVAIIDAYFAMTTNRPYRRAMAPGRALEELERCAGTQFDPKLIMAFLKLVSEKRSPSGQEN